MDSLTKARDTQLKNIESKTGKGIDEWRNTQHVNRKIWPGIR